MASKRSGTSRTYAERKASGQPNVTLSLEQAVVDALQLLAEADGTTKSQVVRKAIKDYLDRRSK